MLATATLVCILVEHGSTPSLDRHAEATKNLCTEWRPFMIKMPSAADAVRDFDHSLLPLPPAIGVNRAHFRLHFTISIFLPH